MKILVFIENSELEMLPSVVIHTVLILVLVAR